MSKRIETDVLIIGSGLSGIRAAIEARDNGARVTMTTKGTFGKDCAATWMVCNGYQCWGHVPEDDLDRHVTDTIRCGWLLNNQENTYAFLAHVPDTAVELLKWGGRYKMKEDGSFDTVWQLGASIPQGRSTTPITWPAGELGFNYQRILPRVVRSKKVDVVEDTYIIDLLSDGDKVTGAVGIDLRTGEFVTFVAKSTILATGGYHGIYKSGTGNPNLSGDGQAIALRAGVDMMDFEFAQTLPVVIWPPAAEGDKIPFDMIMDWDARLYNSEGERFLAKWEPERMEKSTRAIISRAIFHEVAEGRGSPHGGVYLNVSHNDPEFIEKKLAEVDRVRVYNSLKEAGIDLRKDSLETGFRIHYSQGGCDVNTKCETSKPGLYAIGEVASGGKDGSDRMQSNALPYCMSMGIIAGKAAAERAAEVEMPVVEDTQVQRIIDRATSLLDRKEGVELYPARNSFYEVMEHNTSYGRTDAGLRTALEMIEEYKSKILPNLSVANKNRVFNTEWINALEFENLVLVSECVAKSALMRTESRGLHDRYDYPKPDPDWFKNIHVQLVDGELKQWTTPVEFTYWKPAEGSLGEPMYGVEKVKDYEGWRAKPIYESLEEMRRQKK